MNMIRYNSLPGRRYRSGFSPLFDEMQRELERAFNRSMGDSEDDSSSAVADWHPAVDIREVEDAYLLHVDVPGVDPKDIEITLEKGVLSIRGERKLDHEEEDKGYKRVERVRGTFFRRFTLPDTANADEVSAKGENGVLEIRIPKREEEQPRKIAVNA